MPENRTKLFWPFGKALILISRLTNRRSQSSPPSDNAYSIALLQDPQLLGGGTHNIFAHCRVHHRSGDALSPILSAVSSGTRHPWRKRLSKLNHEIMRISLRQATSSYRFNSSDSVSFVNEAVHESSSVALHTRR